MAIPFTFVTADKIDVILIEKRRLYGEMISGNTEFSEVKVLFVEIEHLERSMAELRRNDAPSIHGSM